MSGIVTISISLFIIILALLSFRVIGQFERGILLTFGRYAGTCNPGLITIIPFVQRLIRVDIRLAVNEIPQQDVITKDNVAVKVSAVAYYRVDNPEHAILSVENYHRAVLELAQICVIRSIPTTESV